MCTSTASRVTAAGVSSSASPSRSRRPRACALRSVNGRPRAPSQMPDVSTDPVNVAGAKANAPSDASSRRSQARALFVLACGRRKSLEQQRAELQKRLHQARDDYDATDGLRVVEAA